MMYVDDFLLDMDVGVFWWVCFSEVYCALNPIRSERFN